MTEFIRMSDESRGDGREDGVDVSKGIGKQQMELGQSEGEAVYTHKGFFSEADLLKNSSCNRVKYGLYSS